ncbi:MAG: VCBS repeat-containing protein [Cytophagales bacterium]|nr:VCBS repeat-containing protein [Cytophagales bacterium]
MRIFTVLTLALLVACQAPLEKQTPPLFQALDPASSGFDFTNQLQFDADFNIYTYRNYYNGGGVATGDIDQDGLLDIYVTGNLIPNRLFRNKGNMQFEDITESAGVAGTRSWSTGVSMVDVNGDGLLDIYVCNSGDIKGDNKQNELFINEGNGRFSEQAAAYGLADRGYSTHAAFFDYDKDGDLDAYLLNNSYQAIGSFNLMQDMRPVRDDVGGDKFFRNDGNKFTDISEEAGIYGSVIGFGLGVTVGDVDQDGWQDIFVSNDFFERDYLYLNNGDGTFREDLVNQMPSISAASMGADMADFNNDGYPDIFVTDMLPKPDERIKKVTTFESWDKFIYKIQNNYHKQFNRNMLHLNNGDGTFSEIGRLSGVEATDWSWAALMFDMDNDGRKDLFVANGIYQDITDLDYLNFISDDEFKKKAITREGVDYKALVDPIPITPIPNYAMRNEGNLSFSDQTAAWGFSEPTHSNGSAYVDLDNDGDLDLVVNNVNAPSKIYENFSNELNEHHYLKVTLKGERANPFAIGAKVWVKTADGASMYQEMMPIRGFQSTVDPRLNFGLGTHIQAQELKVTWPSGKITVMKNVAADQSLVLSEGEGESMQEPDVTKPSRALLAQETRVNYSHEENTFVDFDRDRLVFHMISQEGPKLATGDVNGDGLEDVFIGGAKGAAGAILLQRKDGTFRATRQSALTEDMASEDMAAQLVDMDQDGDLDLFVASGGNEFSLGAPELRDRLYMNDGKGNFTKKDDPILRANTLSTSTVVSTDWDQDGDVDLFVGSRARPFLYGVPTNGLLYENDGSGSLKDITREVAPALIDLGMITEAQWVDVDQDKDMDLVIVGEWMTVELFRNDGGKLVRATTEAGLANYMGWWNHLNVADLDQDGDLDLIAGNHGLNSRFEASTESPLQLYINDYDQNGSVDHIFCRTIDGQIKPFTLKHELVAQIPQLKKKYLKYESYVDQTINDIFTEAQIADAIKLEVNYLASAIFWNQGDGTFTASQLPEEVQFSPVFASAVQDLDGDDVPEIVLGGNLYDAKPQAGQYDASYGTVLKYNRRDQSFSVLPRAASGLLVTGEIRDLQFVNAGNDKLLMIARNDDALLTYKINP